MLSNALRMCELLLVGTGGFLGSVARYYLAGLLGGFTPFSAFGYETRFLAREHA